MKKFFAMLLGVIFCFSFTACQLSVAKNGGEIIANLTELPAPSNITVVEDYIHWDEVPNASAYVVKINGIQESVGNSLKYSIATIMDNRLEANVPTELHIYIKAKGNQVLYADSNWSSEFLYVYTKTNKDSTFDKKTNEEYILRIERRVLCISLRR